MRELRIAFDTVDERGAARGRGEQTLEDDERRPLLHDHLERLDGFRIRERDDLPVDLHALAKCGHQVLSSNDQCGRRHPVSLT